MSRVDLNKNRIALLAAYDDVSNHKCKTAWVVYGYEGQTNVLRVVQSGDGDIDDMVDELNSGKVMYAFVRVKDPNTSLHKFVFVNWQGEGVPENKKGIYASHAKDVQNFFRGAHVTINARTEDDLDTDTVVDKVAKSSGSNYSFHQEEAKPEEEAGPVGSVYKKVRPHVEIRSNARDKFWEKARQEEQQRQEEEKNRQQAERGRLDKERREREAQEAKQRDQREAERVRKIQSIKEAEKRANAPTKSSKEGWGGKSKSEEEQQREALRDAEERRLRSEEMKKHRAAEAASLVQSRQNNPRAMFEQKPASIFDADAPKPVTRGPPPPRKLKHTFMEERQETEPPQRKKPIDLPRSPPAEEPQSMPASMPQRTTTPAQPIREPEPVRAREPEPVRAHEPEPVRAHEPEPEAQRAASPVRRSPTPPQVSATSPTSPAATASTNLMQTNLPPRQLSDDEEQQDDDEDWGAKRQAQQEGRVGMHAFNVPFLPINEEEETPSKPTAVIAPASAYEEPEGNTTPEPTAGAYNNQHVASPVEETSPSAEDYGTCARALYDYQAADDTEITFDPGEVITNIDMIDEGWWTGISPTGQHGMFPANYVELIS